MTEFEPGDARLLARALLLGVEEFKLAAEDRMGTHITYSAGNEEKAQKLLDDLVSKGLLEKYVSEILYRCPNCGGTAFRPKLLCPKCQSLSIERGNILIHLSCFYVGFEEDFMPSYLCPKCGETLLDPDTYHRAGSGYRCSACGSIFHRPKEKWVCIGCRKEFELGETRSEVLSSYKLTKLGIRAAEAYSNGLREIVHVLLGKGLKVSVLGLLQGLSGAKHEYEILAEDDDTYIIGTSLLQEAKATELVKFFSILHDLQSKGIFIAVPGLDPDAMKVLSDSKVSTRLSLIEASSIPEMKQKLRDFFFSSRSKLPNSIPIAR